MVSSGQFHVLLFLPRNLFVKKWEMEKGERRRLISQAAHRPACGGMLEVRLNTEIGGNM